MFGRSDLHNPLSWSNGFVMGEVKEILPPQMSRDHGKGILISHTHTHTHYQTIFIFTSKEGEKINREENF